MKLIFKDNALHSEFSGNIVSLLQEVQAKSRTLYNNDIEFNHLSTNLLGGQLLGQINIDFTYLYQAKTKLKLCSLINVVFHCPFVKDQLPGTFYMPKLNQTLVDRAVFVYALSRLHVHLNEDYNPVTILITTPTWYYQNLNVLKSSSYVIIPVFIKDEIKYPMYLRHAAYVAVAKKISELVGFKKCVISFHDSDLLPIASWKSTINKILNQSFDALFTYRFSPNLLPLNGGLFFVSLSPKALFLLTYSLVLYEKLSRDEFLLKTYPDNIKIWDGDQIVLNTIYDTNNENPFKQYSKLNKSKLGILPAWNMNHSVKKYQKNMIRDLINENIKAIHLKGKIKESMNTEALNNLIDEIIMLNKCI